MEPGVQLAKQEIEIEEKQQQQQYNNNSDETKKALNEKDLKKLHHLEEQSKPLWLTKQFVDRPCMVVVVCSIIFVIATLLTVVFNYMEQSTSSQRDWLVWSEEKVEDYDLFEEAKYQLKKQNEDKEVPIRSESQDSWTTFVMLECYKDCDNVLSAHNFNILMKTEDEIQNNKDFQNFCLATTSSTDCSSESFSSFTQQFTQQQRQNGVSQQELDDKLEWVLQEENWGDYKHYFGNDFSSEKRKTKYLQSIFRFGAPINIDGKRYKTQYDDEDKQKEKFTDFSDILIDITDKHEKNTKDGVNILIFSEPVSDLMMNEVVNQDFVWILASVSFVWIYMTFHIGSFFLSSFSILNIIMSFPLTLVIFRSILQIGYYSSLHILVVFIVLGIAADDVFVFIDAWFQTEQYEQLRGDLHKRMAVTYRRASRAMLATSSTTACAFFATGFSTIMPISSFGIFAGILIPMNYILVITFFPALVIIQHKYFRTWCTRKNNKTELPQQQQQQDQQVEQKEEVKEKKVEVFFGTTFNDFVFKFRYIIVVIFSLWTIGAAVMAAQMGPLTKQDEWLPESFDLQRAMNHVTQDFHQSGDSDSVIDVSIVWGCKGLDKGDVGAWEVKNRGDIQWDNSFDLAPQENQQFIYDTCQKLKQQSFVLDGQVECFMEGFRDYLVNKGKSFPVQQSEFMQEFKLFSEDGSDIGGQKFVLDQYIGFIKGELKFVGIKGISIGDVLAPYKEKEKIEVKWENFEKQLRSDAPQGVDKPIQMSMFWAWMVSQAAFVVNAVQGTLISLSFALVVLLLTTQNIVISFYSITSIIGIVISVISVMWMNGWEFGVAESITVVILIGFSVDYVVHLANHYVESSYDDKFTRTQESLREIGVSILSGSITTLGSGVFLFLAVVSIFGKFAVLIVATISFSLVYALLFFCALLHAFGPQGEYGDMVAMYKKLRKTEKVSSEISHNQQKQQQAGQV